MGTIEQEILNTINTYGIWIIILLILILINTCGIYTLLKKLVKWEKEKHNERTILFDKINHTNGLLRKILNQNETTEQKQQQSCQLQPNEANNGINQ